MAAKTGTGAGRRCRDSLGEGSVDVNCDRSTMLQLSHISAHAQALVALAVRNCINLFKTDFYCFCSES